VTSPVHDCAVAELVQKGSLRLEDFVSTPDWQALTKHVNFLHTPRSHALDSALVLLERGGVSEDSPANTLVLLSVLLHAGVLTLSDASAGVLQAAPLRAAKRLR